MPSPTDITYESATKILTVRFDDGRAFDLPAELLRVESPSAEVQGHRPEDKVVVAGKRLVGITAVEPVGNYAVRIVFDDGHDSGYFTWDYLYGLGRDKQTVWRSYLDALAKTGLSRDPKAARL